MLPSTVALQVFAEFAALLSEHGAPNKMLAPVGVERATTSVKCKIKQFPTEHE